MFWFPMIRTGPIQIELISYIIYSYFRNYTTIYILYFYAISPLFVTICTPLVILIFFFDEHTGLTAQTKTNQKSREKLTKFLSATKMSSKHNGSYSKTHTQSSCEETKLCQAVSSLIRFTKDVFPLHSYVTNAQGLNLMHQRVAWVPSGAPIHDQIHSKQRIRFNHNLCISSCPCKSNTVEHRPKFCR